MESTHSRLSLSTTLVEENHQFWNQWLPHSFTRAVADQSIEPEIFNRWLCQDYLFVREGTRFLALLLSKAPTRLLGALVDVISAWNTELGLFRDKAAAAGIDLDQKPFMVTSAYSDFLLATAQQESFAVGWAVLYGVERAYHDAWKWVGDNASQGKTPQEKASPDVTSQGNASQDNPFGEWIDNWASPAFGEFVDFLGNTLDSLAEEGLTEREVARIREKFEQTARYEVLFWEMAQSGDVMAGR